jgi:hypothetical protein
MAVVSALYVLFHSSIIVPSERLGKVFHPLVARGLSGITCRGAGYWNGRGSWKRAAIVIKIEPEILNPLNLRALIRALGEVSVTADLFRGQPQSKSPDYWHGLGQSD